MVIQLKKLEEMFGVSGARERFEALVTRLVQVDHPGARTIRVSRGDGGIDTFVGEFARRPLQVWQSKFFLGSLDPSRKQQIKRSFETARKNPRFSVGEWTLVVACDLSQDEQMWFEAWSAEFPDVAMDYWNEDEVVRRLHLPENEHVRIEFFATDTETRIRELHEAVCQRRAEVPWSQVRRSLLTELDEMAEIAEVVARCSANDPVISWSTKVWRTRRTDIERVLSTRPWWPDLTDVYEQWLTLKAAWPAGHELVGGAERAASAVLRRQDCQLMANQLWEDINAVRDELLDEIRAGVASTELEAFMAWRRARIADICDGETPRPLVEGVRLVVHVASATSFSSKVALNLGDAKSVLPSPGVGGWDHFHDVDSFAIARGGDGLITTYTQLFANGVSEYVVVGSGAGGNLLGVEQLIVDAVKRLAVVPSGLNLDGPFLIAFDLLGTKGATIQTNSFTYPWKGREIRRDQLSPPPEIVDSLEEVETSLRPALDWIWRAAGFEECHRYKPDGSWRESW